MDPVIEIAIDTVEKKKQALVFCNSKKGAEKQAEDIAKSKRFRDHVLSNNSANIENEVIFKKIADEFEGVLPQPTKQCKRDADCLRYGVAFHHAGLTSEQKNIIEDGFRNGFIKIICATPTLAAGVDLPAFRSVVKDLKRFSGNWGMQFIPVLEFEQMAGRAGRPGKEDFGEALTIAASENEKAIIVDNYIYGDVENIQSKLAVEPVLRCHVLSLVASGFVKTQEELVDFFSQTFYAMQFGDLDKIETIINKVTMILCDYGFIVKNDFKDGTSKNSSLKISAASLFEDANKINSRHEIHLSATPIGKRISELYLDPYTGNQFIKCLEKAEKEFPKYTSEDKTLVLLQAISNTLEMRPQLRVKSKENDLYYGIYTEKEDLFISNVPDEYEFDDYLNSIKTAVYFNNWISEVDEESLLEKFDIRPGETRQKLDISDWLMRCAIDIAKAKGYFYIVKDLVKLQIRLKYGVKEELLALLQLEGIGRVRARKLYNNGVKDIGDLKQKSLVELIPILGQKIAENVLKQVKV